MNPHDNTPPDGDFVRYVERLTAAQAQAPAAPAAAADMRPTSARAPAAQALTTPLPAATAIKVGAALVAGLLALNLLFGVPGLVLSAVIVGLGWAAWRGLRFWSNAGGLVRRLVERAREFEKKAENQMR